jgi:hypothetical protein
MCWAGSQFRPALQGTKEKQFEAMEKGSVSIRAWF